MSPVWVAGIPVVGSSSAAFPGAPAESWIRSWSLWGQRLALQCEMNNSSTRCYNTHAVERELCRGGGLLAQEWGEVGLDPLPLGKSRGSQEAHIHCCLSNVLIQPRNLNYLP